MIDGVVMGCLMFEDNIPECQCSDGSQVAGVFGRTTVINNFDALSSTNQQDLVNFLRSL